jgi:hypothetical protein
MADHNANYVGGDISAGAMSTWQLVKRPVVRWNQYATPVPGVYLCSSSAPPAPGVHGMCGFHAARHALRARFGDRVRYATGCEVADPSTDGPLGSRDPDPKCPACGPFPVQRHRCRVSP